MHALDRCRSQLAGLHLELQLVGVYCLPRDPLGTVDHRVIAGAAPPRLIQTGPATAIILGQAVRMAGAADIDPIGRLLDESFAAREVVGPHAHDSLAGAPRQDF